nr:cbb3-type cytochrome c oxidase subunit I [Sulfitobacter algicola]
MLYMGVAGTIGLFGIVLAIYIQLEMMNPSFQYFCLDGLQLSQSGDLCGPNPYLFGFIVNNGLTLLVFFCFIPAIFGGFGSYVLPQQIGAPSLMLPSINGLSFWLFAISMAVGILFLINPSHIEPQTDGIGWQLYPPLSSTQQSGLEPRAIFAISGVALSIVLNIVALIVTFMKDRPAGQRMSDTPLFSMLVFVTSWPVLLSLPLMMFMFAVSQIDRNFGMTFFDPNAAGDPVLYQHVLWFLGAPEISGTVGALMWLALLLLVLGVISHFKKSLNKPPILHYAVMVYSLLPMILVGLAMLLHIVLTSGL